MLAPPLPAPYGRSCRPPAARPGAKLLQEGRHKREPHPMRDPTTEQTRILKDLLAEVTIEYRGGSFWRADLVHMDESDFQSLKKGGYLTWSEGPSAFVRLTDFGRAWVEKLIEQEEEEP